MAVKLLFIVIVFWGLIVLFFAILFSPKFTGKRSGFLWGIAAIAAAVTLVVFELQEIYAVGSRRSILPLVVFDYICRGLSIVFGTSFALRMHSKWIEGKLTEEEKLPNGQGIRAWLGVGNMFLVVAISFCAWRGYDYSFWGVLIILTGLVIAKPAIGMYMQRRSPGVTVVQPPGPDLTVVRERILGMLEAGKITPDEAAELLNSINDNTESTSNMEQPDC